MTSPNQTTENNRTGIQSVEFAMDLLKILIESSEGLSLTMLAKKSGMAPSRAHKYLLSLLRVGLVEQTARGQYDIGSLAMELGFAALDRLEVADVAQDYLDDLRNTLTLDCCLAVWADGGPVIIRRSQSNQPISLHVQLGQRLPMLRSANGLVFGAFLDQTMTKDLIAKELKRQDGVELRTRAEVEMQFEQIRKQGMSIVSGSMLSGVNAICCPVFDYRHQICAGITLLGLTHRLPVDSASDAAKALVATAAELSRHLGYRSQSEKKKRTATL